MKHIRLGEGIDWTSTKPAVKVRRVTTITRDADGNIVATHDDNRRRRDVERDDNGDIVSVTEFEAD